ncbi:TolC family protein [Tautonia rosea]|uniref:TolC family protein n=1 Tax=Tautonia rosea TaxID=2728037 RepID=UPI0014743D29|nr:TolC family protein [Tautonia rosea]
MITRFTILGTVLMLAVIPATHGAKAQQATEPPTSFGQGLQESTLGRAPGSMTTQMPSDRPGLEGTIGNRPGPGTPRVPFSITTPESSLAPPGLERVLPLPELPIAAMPLYGTLELPTDPDAPFDPNALTLDQAIQRLMEVNPTLRALSFELPQAEADVLTAGLRANPILFTDAQMIPYQPYTDARPGGQTQYDLNISYPLDLTGKRRARIRFASRVFSVIEAQYQDAVRREIDNLSIAFVDVLAARETVRLAEAGARGLERVLELTETLREQGLQTEADVNRVRIQQTDAEIALADSEEALRRTKRTLGSLLAIHPAEAEDMPVEGQLVDPIAAPPTIEELTELALAARPDLLAYRLGIDRAKAQVDLEVANRLSDVFLLYQPFTYQDNSPFDLPGATSWALGITIPLPVFNRNQGNIQRARVNFSQSRSEYDAIVQQVVVEVRQAEQEFHNSRSVLRRVEAEQLPAAEQILESTDRLFSSGEIDAVAYLNVRREYNDVIRRWRDLLVRHRRSMLALNTAVGQRVLP